MTDYSAMTIATRRALGLSQAEFARRIGITRAQVSRIETGACRPHEVTRRAIEAIARDYGVPLAPKPTTSRDSATETRPENRALVSG